MSGTPKAEAASPPVNRILGIVMLAIFASTLSVRAVDPVIPQIAADLATEATTAALLSTAFALPFAMTQPVLGALADRLGKTLLMTISLVALIVTAFAAAATDRKSTRLNSSHSLTSRMPSSA